MKRGLGGRSGRSRRGRGWQHGPWLWGALLAAFVALSALAAAAEPAGVPGEGSARPYRLAPGDVLQVGVWGHEDLEVQVPVRPDGSFSFPLVGDVPAAGRSVEDVRQDLEARLAAFVREPRVWVSLMAIGQVRVQVLGEVARPGVVEVPHGAHLLDAVAQAGGLTPGADAARVQLQRPAEAGGGSARVRLDLYLRAGDASGNPPLQGGETIVVPRRATYLDWSRLALIVSTVKVVYDLLQQR